MKQPQAYEFVLPKKLKHALIFIGGMIPLVILIIWGAIHTANIDSSIRAKNIAPDAVVNKTTDGSLIQVVDYLKNNLRDPDSYEGIEWSKVEKVDNLPWRFVVRHKYRAKNGFGGYNVANTLFYLDSQGNVIKTKDD